MKDNANKLLNILLGCTAGFFAADSLYVIWRHSFYPEWYGMRAMPWYADIWPVAAISAAVAVICVTAKLLLKYNNR